MSMKIEQRSQGWCVLAYGGREILAGPFPDRAGAERARDDIRARKQRRLRPCLCCGKQFTSEGSHNRLCQPCRQSADGTIPDWSLGQWSGRGLLSGGARG